MVGTDRHGRFPIECRLPWYCRVSAAATVVGVSPHIPCGPLWTSSSRVFDKMGLRNKPGPQKRSTASDPTSLLARGFLSRYTLPSGLAPLSQDETDKDLRHMNAYRSAVISYRQQYYIAVNRLTVEDTASTSPSPLSSLPVKLDPEEEKRLTVLRKKIARAEHHREDLEQQYVALRAHYVAVSQSLQAKQAFRAASVDFLQAMLEQRSSALGLLRARLQMTRDVLMLLHRRASALEASGIVPGGPPPTLSGASNMEDVWNAVEDDLKKAVSGRKKPKKPMAWPATKLPATPMSVPLLLSAASLVPEKSTAFGTSGAFGADPASLVWMEDHLPADTSEMADETAKVTSLQEEALFLAAELAKERSENERLSEQIAAARSKNDEWVSMICLVRQETESVLFRHNIVLESEMASEAAEDYHRRVMAERAANQQADAATAETASDSAAPEAAPATLGADEANDGDDEGSEEEEEAVSSKRSAEEEGAAMAAKKRRRL